MRFISDFTFIIISLGIFGLLNNVYSDTIRIAVASNFVNPARHIANKFRTTTGHNVIISIGSTGKLYAQIKNGAPYALFLAADSTTPKKLVQEGYGVAKTRFTYAIGKLVLWSNNSKFTVLKSSILRGSYGTLAIANPKLAPYGLAAKETLIRLGLWNRVQKHLVMGENIGQTMQFAYTGNADLAFVAYSQTINRYGHTLPGTIWQVPQRFYRPIRQDAILVKSHQQNNQTALAFLQFLKSSQAITIITQYGYAIPL